MFDCYLIIIGTQEEVGAGVGVGAGAGLEAGIAVGA